MSAGIYHNKILYICPAKPIAYQIGSHFKYMGYKVNFVVDKIFTNNNNNNIYVGTPLEIENNINKLGIDFDYVVFDEIHNINHNELGSIYENLLKLFDCNILGVSASVNNIGYLKECYEKNHKRRDQRMSKYVQDHCCFLKGSLEIVLCMCKTNTNYHIAVNARSQQYMSFQ